MNYHLMTYGIYLAVAVPLTLWVAGTLYRHGRVFLVDAFRGNEVLADSVNRLLLVGFYLVNVGYVLLYLRYGPPLAGVGEVVEVVEVVASKVGWVMLVLGGMHFMNLYVFHRLRKRAMVPAAPPVLPVVRLAEAPDGVGRGDGVTA